VKLKRLVSLIAASAMACGITTAQQAGSAPSSISEAEVASEAIPPDVLASAVAAVGKLGDEVVLGHYQVAVQRMNPLWKKRTAQHMGGEEVLEKQLAGVAAQMAQQGISMISCKPVGQPIPYEVAPGKKRVKENGVEVDKLVYTKWLVLVPTMTQFRIFPAGAKRALVIDSTSFQVAVCEKGKNDWTFIDGANLNAGDLRGLFSTLPRDMELPPVKKHEVR
jgi:hypothetical protein